MRLSHMSSCNWLNNTLFVFWRDKNFLSPFFLFHPFTHSYTFINMESPITDCIERRRSIREYFIVAVDLETEFDSFSFFIGTRTRLFPRRLSTSWSRTSSFALLLATSKYVAVWHRSFIAPLSLVLPHLLCHQQGGHHQDRWRGQWPVVDQDCMWLKLFCLMLFLTLGSLCFGLLPGRWESRQQVRWEGSRGLWYPGCHHRPILRSLRCLRAWFGYVSTGTVWPNSFLLGRWILRSEGQWTLEHYQRLRASWYFDHWLPCRRSS